ncbi:hypothetical protein E2C01_014429 [Portunus trituberculatus]|uniref:Uncharacterized protein n=1 Tax=Portunus trituberculatus TaxID=210409 RepID=A0A5B7DJZ1_PORTR|nr:hypothetical protein [Portunus trituberculatus]
MVSPSTGRHELLEARQGNITLEDLVTEASRTGACPYRLATVLNLKEEPTEEATEVLRTKMCILHEGIVCR